MESVRHLDSLNPPSTPRFRAHRTGYPNRPKRAKNRVLSQWGDGFGLALLFALHNLPPAPFELRPGHTVTDGEHFSAVLLRDALRGPSDPRGDRVEADVRALILCPFSPVAEESKQVHNDLCK